MKLMQKIMLSCTQATFFSSVKRFKKLKVMHRIQHRLHLMMCKNCKEFDKQNQIIDQTLDDIHKNTQLLTDEHLSSEKKQQLQSTVNQYIK